MEERPGVVEMASEAYPMRPRHGVCIWLTGLGGSGKSTIAKALAAPMTERGWKVTVLKEAAVTALPSDWREDDSDPRGRGKARTKDRRIGAVASEIVRRGEVAVCARVSPYRVTRDQVRSLIGKDDFIEVFVNTPADLCEQRRRDRRRVLSRVWRVIKAGLRHRSPRLMWLSTRKGFIEVNYEPYEPPENPNMELDDVSRSAEENARLILDYLADNEIHPGGRSKGATDEDPYAVTA